MQNLELPLKLDTQELKLIENRLKEFTELNKRGSKAWFSELCFCLLTANSQAKRAIKIQNHLTAEGFINKSEQEIAEIIRSFGHRFHNTKAKYIVLARTHLNIKEILQEHLNISTQAARNFLVENIKGLGYKEASHFLRNIGFHDVAIIDRHIIKFLYKYSLIKQIPKVINKKIYLDLESLLKGFNIDLDRLDLTIWYHMTGSVLK